MSVVELKGEATDTGSVAGVRVERLGRVAVLELDRPGRGNSVDLAMAHRLHDVMGELATLGDALGAVVLTGAGKDFCVGGDLRDFAQAPVPGRYVRELADAAHEAILAMRALTVPVIVSAQGECAGAGLGLVLAADLVLAETTTRFRAAYTAVGLSPDCGVSWGLTRLLGAPRAADLILTNRVLDGTEAQVWGLVSRLCQPSTAALTARALAGEIADGAATAHRYAVQLIRGSVERPLIDHLQEEAALIADAAASDEGVEGVRAFLAKRSPDFREARLGSPSQPRASRTEPAAWH